MTYNVFGATLSLTQSINHSSDCETEISIRCLGACDDVILRRCCVQTMKTYHTYFGDSQQAESKLKRAKSQRVKSDQTSVIGRHFGRDYEKLSEKVRNSGRVCSFNSDLVLLV